jgi:hypothetical protein
MARDAFHANTQRAEKRSRMRRFPDLGRVRASPVLRQDLRLV